MAKRCKRCETILHTLNKARGRALCERCKKILAAEYAADYRAQHPDYRRLKLIKRAMSMIAEARGK